MRVALQVNGHLLSITHYTPIVDRIVLVAAFFRLIMPRYFLFGIGVDTFFNKGPRIAQPLLCSLHYIKVLRGKVCLVILLYSQL